MGEEPSRGSLRDQIGFTGAVWAAKWGRMGSLRQLPQEHRLAHGESFSLVFLPTHTAMMSGANPYPFLVLLVPAQTGRAAFLAQKVFWTFSTYPLLLEGVVAVGLQFHPCSGQEIVFISVLPATLARVYIPIQLLLLRKAMDITQKGSYTKERANLHCLPQSPSMEDVVEGFARWTCRCSGPALY